MQKRVCKIIIALFLILTFIPVYASATNGTDVTLIVDPEKTAAVGDKITLNGEADPNTFVSIKVIDSGSVIVHFHAVKSDNFGNYETEFLVPEVDDGELTIVAGYGTNVATKTLSVGENESQDPDEGDKPQDPGGGGGSIGDKDDEDIEEPIPTPDDEEYNLDDSDITQEVTTEADGRKSLNIKIDEQKVIEKLEKTQVKELILKAYEAPEILNVEVPNKIIKRLAGNKSNFIVESNDASYILPVDQLDLGQIADESGMDKGKININITIAETEKSKQEKIQNRISDEEMKLISKPTEFEVKAVSGDKKKIINRFKKHIKRTITINKNADTNIATGIVLAQDNSIKPVPTKFTKNDGKIIAEINSMTNSVYAVVENKKGFLDTINHWAEKDIHQLASRMIVNGVDEESYIPENEVTRAEFAAIVTRALDLPEEGATKDFSDIKGNEWFVQNVNTAVAFEIIQGYPDGTFRPDDSITRQEVAVMVVRALNIVEGKQDIKSGTVEKFKDAEMIGEWAKDDVACAVDKEIIKGYPDGSFAPEQTCTRAEAAVMVKRVLSGIDFM